MKQDYARKILLEQHVKWSGEYSVYLERARAAKPEEFEVKDENYRRAAVLGIRLDSISRVTAIMNGQDDDKIGWLRAMQRHMRDMARLKYRERPVHMQSDGIDMEVMSQFFASDDPQQNALYQQLMTGKKLRPNEAAAKPAMGSGGRFSGYANNVH